MKGCNAEFYKRLDLEFVEVWNRSEKVSDVGDHFGRDRFWASRRANLLRDKGYELKQMAAVTKRRIKREVFIETWNKSASIASVANKLDMGFDDCRRKARELRLLGYKLKAFIGTQQILAVKTLKPPADYCCWAPGSPEKVETMARRLSNGEMLFHPQDATFSHSLNPHWQVKAAQ